MSDESAATDALTAAVNALTAALETRWAAVDKRADTKWVGAQSEELVTLRAAQDTDQERVQLIQARYLKAAARAEKAELERDAVTEQLKATVPVAVDNESRA